MRRNISNWIQAAPSTVAGLDLEHHSGELDIAPTLDHQSLLRIPVPNTKLGTLHSAALVESRVEGLFITEQNVTKLLQLAGGEEPARQLLNFLAKWNAHVFVIVKLPLHSFSNSFLHLLVYKLILWI